MLAFDLLLQLTDLGGLGVQLGAEVGDLGILLCNGLGVFLFVIALSGGEFPGGFLDLFFESAHRLVVLDSDGRGGSLEALICLLESVAGFLGFLDFPLEILNLDILVGKDAGQVGIAL